MDNFFEGAEKRLVLETDMININALNWKLILKDIGCTVLNLIQGKNLIMFLLGESILMIKNNIIMLKTCGQTSPLNLINHLIKNNIKIINFEYSHPNFLRPELQPELYLNLKNEMDYLSQNLQINKSISYLHMNYINSKSLTPFYEITLWDFTWNDIVIEIIKNNLKGFTIDDFKFKPNGYSLNGFKDEGYITIHVTPNESCSYLSVETNDFNSNLIDEMIQSLNPHKIGLFSNMKLNWHEKLTCSLDSKVYFDNDIFIKYYS